MTPLIEWKAAIMVLYSKINFNLKLTGERFERYFENLAWNVRGSIHFGK